MISLLNLSVPPAPSQQVPSLPLTVLWQVPMFPLSCVADLVLATSRLPGATDRPPHTFALHGHPIFSASLCTGSRVSPHGACCVTGAHALSCLARLCCVADLVPAVLECPGGNRSNFNPPPFPPPLHRFLCFFNSLSNGAVW